MSVNTSSTYNSPGLLFNKHLQTIYPALLRGVKLPDYVRERIDTSDGDFLDLDWVRNEHSHLVVISHGLEGNSTRAYMTGMVNAFVEKDFDVLAWNFRGCSEELNRKPYSYHSGATYDLETVVKHGASQGYQKISLIGFSLGGNMTLKYLGEDSTLKPAEIVSAVTFSVPLDLYDCSKRIHHPSNFLYERRFLKSFFKKIKAKSKEFEEVDLSKLEEVKSVYDFDELYTAPLSGYESAIDYYDRCSSMKFIKGITVPTLVVNALNDPFLGPNCFDQREFEKTDVVSFELPKEGGHCGFPSFNNSGCYWSEMRALEFVMGNG